MKSFMILSAVAALALSLNASSVTLDGSNVTSRDIVDIANGAKVGIDQNAFSKVKKAHEILLNAAKDGQKIYGLTVGVGLNKDKNFVSYRSKKTKRPKFKTIKIYTKIIWWV